MSISINTDLICKNPANMGHDANGNLTHRQPSDIKYIVVHYTGCADSTAYNFAEYTKHGTPGASANYIVGFAGEIYQSIEDLDIAWHVGIGTNPKPGIEYLKPDGVWQADNFRCLGIEMCCRKINHSTLSGYDSDWYFEDATVNATIELVQLLMVKYNIDIDHVIRHYDSNTWYKPCPRPYALNDINSVYGKTGNQLWSDFKKRVTGIQPSPTPKQEISNPWIKYHSAYTGIVRAERIDVRTSASNNAEILREYPALGYGNLIDVIGQTSSSNWSYVRIAGKYYGWVLTKYVVDYSTKNRSILAQKVTMYDNKAKYIAAEVKSFTKVYTAPDSESEQLNAHPELGECNLVDIVGLNKDGTWACVNIVGVKGWIQRNIVK